MASVGEYELDFQMGAGAAGTVWKAHASGPVNRTVALKRLRAVATSREDLARIRREAAVLAELDHPHIVRILDVLDDGDGIALAMQFAPGGSLEALLAERGTLPPGEVVAVAVPMAEALASAHRKGILHGDVKPANILFTSDGEPLLTDFGVARTLGMLTSDQVTGTAEYLAPELLDGAQPAASADVYSLGIMCYQALAGRPPFTGPVPLAVVRAADHGLHDPLSEVPGVPAPLAEVVERAMARDPRQRFASAGDLAAALQSTVSPQERRLPGTAAASNMLVPVTDDPVRATRSFGPRPPRPEPHQKRLRLPRSGKAALLVGITLAAGLALLFGPWQPFGGNSDDTAGGAADRNGRDSGPSDCPDIQEPLVTPGHQRVEGDPEGDGCATVGVYGPQAFEDGQDRMVLSIHLDGQQANVLLGEPGDQLFLGDWNCDGRDTPGVYRMTEGEVWYFEGWPQDAGQPYQPETTERVPAGSEATRRRMAEDQTGSPDSCDRIIVAGV